MKIIKEKIKELGGQSAFALLLDVKQQQVWNWLNRDKQIPSEFVIKVEGLLNIPCWEIRPDLYPPERFKKTA